MGNGLVGNIHSFLPEFKNWDAKAIAVFQSNLETNATNFLKDFVADFSFVKILSDNKIIAARDHIGVFPLYYYDDVNCLILANDQRLITGIQGLDLACDFGWMGDFVTQSEENPNSTFYKYIKKVPPAHILEYEGGQLTITRYWEMDIHRSLPEQTDDTYIAEFTVLLQQAVECRIPDDINIGSEVSGGIDCTSVASIAKSYLDKQNRPLFTYAHASLDEAKYPCEKEAINRFIAFLQPFKHTFTPEKISGMCRVMDHAFQLGNGIAYCHYASFSKAIFEKAGSDQVKIVFSGNGGDHGVSFKGYHAVIGSYIAQGDLKTAFRELKIIHKNPAKAIASLLFWWLRITINPKTEKRYRKTILSALQALKAMQRGYPGLLQYNYKKRSSAMVFNNVREHLAEKLAEAELSNRCEATTIAAAHYGVIYRYPLLDIRLLQYLLSLPPRMLHQNGINRYIFRKTIERWVPKTMAYQPKPPANMYGWILEAYKFDYDHQIEYSLIPENEETRFYLDFWKYRDEITRKGDLFKSII